MLDLNRTSEVENKGKRSPRLLHLAIHRQLNASRGLLCLCAAGDTFPLPRDCFCPMDITTRFSPSISPLAARQGWGLHPHQRPVPGCPSFRLTPRHPVGVHLQGPEEARPGGRYCRVAEGWLGWGAWVTPWPHSRTRDATNWDALGCAVPVALEKAVAMGTRQI